MIEIVVAIITGGLAFAGVLVSNLFAAKKARQSQATAQAVTDTKLEELTREVREHNGFARRVPLLEQEVKDLKNGIHRLEGFHMNRDDR